MILFVEYNKDLNYDRLYYSMKEAVKNHRKHEQQQQQN